MFQITGATEQQQSVIYHNDGPAEVFAGPGAGKTFTLTCRTARLLADGIPPEQLLLLTFTNKAAGEMKTRIRHYVGERGEAVEAGTFHGFSTKLLIRYGRTINFPRITILSSGECVSMIRRLRDGIDKVERDTIPTPKQCLSLFSKASNTGKHIAVLMRENQKLREYNENLTIQLYKAYQDEKRFDGLLDFDDILIYTSHLLENVDWVRDALSNQYRYIMVDEYQDTNMLQARIVRALASRFKNLMIVGDVQQSIFGFRGADYQNILFFQKEYPDAKRYTLSQNFRSVPEIVNVANHIIRTAKDGDKTPLQAHRDVPGTVFIEQFETPMDEGEWIVTYIAELLQQGILPSDIAILYRNNFHATSVEGFLKGMGFPYRRTRGTSFAEGEHIQDVLAFLRVARDNSKVAWIRIFCMIKGIGTKTAEKLYQQCVVENRVTINNTYMSTVLSLIKWVRTVTQPTTSEQVYALCQDAMRQYAMFFREKWEDEKERLRRKKDMYYILNFAKKVTSLDDFLCYFLIDDEVADDEEDDDKPHITLTTIHGAKAREWRVVFLIQCSDGNLPTGNAEDIEEERRLFYVACTRPKDALLITHTLKGIGDSDKRQQASRFIDGIQ